MSNKKEISRLMGHFAHYLETIDRENKTILGRIENRLEALSKQVEHQAIENRLEALSKQAELEKRLDALSKELELNRAVEKRLDALVEVIGLSRATDLSTDEDAESFIKKLIYREWVNFEAAERLRKNLRH